MSIRLVAPSAGIGGTVEIADRPAVGGGIHSANLAPLGNYIASMFATRHCTEAR